MKNVEYPKDFIEEIMVVDDSIFNLTLMSDILNAAGYKVRTAKNGAIALEYIEEKKPDMILLDVNMPGLSGYEVCQKIKDNKLNKDIPVIFVSALTESEDKITGFNAGGVDFISKPFNPKEVLVRVKTHLNLIRLQKQLTEKNVELEDALKSLKVLQMKLIQEDKMASIGQLSAGIAHEINNPLGFVSSNFSTLKKYNGKLRECIIEYRNFKESLKFTSSNEVKNKIERINDLEEKNKIEYIMTDLEELYNDTNNGLERIKKIVITLKNFVHESNDDSFENYDLNQGILDTLEISRNELKYNIETQTNLDEKLPIIKAKTSEINQVLLNIIINASHALKEKYNTDSGGKIIITTWNDEKFAYCTLEDNGVGIQEKNITKIFNPFFTTKQVGKGAGLGLSISYDIIVNKHNGNIEVKSTLGEGTKFILTLPINEEVGDACGENNTIC